ncbi:MAG: DUF1572 family protein [Bacteroidetes bacterium]|nr:DUF1572 family protein [Bacteroidota bacterium]
MVQNIKELYISHLEKTIAEITLYTNEADIWAIAPGILNSAGNLSLHIVGNLNLFIGAHLNNSGYVRNREAEFSLKDISKAELTAMLQATQTMINNCLSAMDNNDLEKVYPIDKFGEGRSIGYVFVYLLAHLDYHLGQINYHRRLLNK